MTADNLHYEKYADGSVKCIEDEIPFDVPEGWAWTRLGVICPYGDTIKIDANDIRENEWILDLEDVEKDTGRIISFVLKSERNSVSQKHKFERGQLLYSKLRPYLNKVLIAPEDGYCTSEILPLTLYGGILPEFIKSYMMSNTFLAYVDLISYGVKMPRLGTDDGKRALIAVPPIHEQCCIIGKIQELTPIIQSLAEQSNELTTIIGTIKSHILNLAIRGKLVPQDPSDEPASVLLERIRAEKEELIKQGKIKRYKKESVIFKGEDNSYYEKIGSSIKNIDDEIPFDIPDNWCWCRLETIGDWKSGSTPSRRNPSYYGGNIPWIKTGDLNDGYITDIPETITQKALLETAVKLIPKNTVLIAMYGATIGKVGITTCEATTNQACCACCNPITVSEKYLFYFLQSQKNYFERIAVGGAQPNISKEKIVATSIPIPPLAEQNKIVDTILKLYLELDDISYKLN